MAIECFCIYRQWDDSISTAIPSSPNVSSLSRIRRGKRKERDSTDPNPRREDDKEGEEETVAARKKRQCTGKRRKRELYCIYRTLGNLHIDLPRKCVIHGSRTSRKQKLILARSWYSGEPIWIGDAGAHARTHWRRRGMKMRGDDCLRRAGKRNLGRGRKESAWSGRRGAKGGLRLANMSISKGKRETDVTVERDNRPFFPCDTLYGIFNLCVINKYVNSRICVTVKMRMENMINLLILIPMKIVFRTSSLQFGNHLNTLSSKIGSNHSLEWTSQ